MSESPGGFVPSRHARPVLVADWRDAEELAEWHMRGLGFADARLTRSGADGGVDVEAAEAIGQVKHLAGAVGAPEVQQARGAAHGRAHALFYALAGYTSAALAFAADAVVALFTYNVYGDVEPANEHAVELARGGHLAEQRAGVTVEPATLGERIDGAAPLTSGQSHDLRLFVLHVATFVTYQAAEKAGPGFGHEHLAPIRLEVSDRAMRLISSVRAVFAAPPRLWSDWFRHMDSWVDGLHGVLALDLAHSQADKYASIDEVVENAATWGTQIQVRDIESLWFTRDPTTWWFPPDDGELDIMALRRGADDEYWVGRDASPPGPSIRSMVSSGEGGHIETCFAIVDMKPFGLGALQTIDLLREIAESSAYAEGRRAVVPMPGS
ncbi:restriction endonuclease [Promicromonospora alba]|uniref:Restriction endonuclease n=1 Tax=Promicromonospora alba TaxID=1616110 RepID=A0ABV9HJU8_9MICO